MCFVWVFFLCSSSPSVFFPSCTFFLSRHVCLFFCFSHIFTFTPLALSRSFSPLALFPHNKTPHAPLPLSLQRIPYHNVLLSQAQGRQISSQCLPATASASPCTPSLSAAQRRFLWARPCSPQISQPVNSICTPNANPPPHISNISGVCKPVEAALEQLSHLPAVGANHHKKTFRLYVRPV